ncbi:hypothetical protein KJ855_01275 [Patescibacteria group bacterium]|nr:hypothetical protein [Patescibacteria group bacterium]
MEFFYQIAFGLGVAVLLFVVLWLGVVLFKKMIRHRDSFTRTLNMAVLQVRVQKEVPEDEQKKAPKEIIAVAEHLFASFYSIYQGGWRNWLFGEQHISIEISTKNGLTDFYVVVPRALVELIRKQMNAQLPDAIIDELEEGYNIFEE